jgi:hypothetical protein
MECQVFLQQIRRNVQANSQEKLRLSVPNLSIILRSFGTRPKTISLREDATNADAYFATLCLRSPIKVSAEEMEVIRDISTGYQTASKTLGRRGWIRTPARWSYSNSMPCVDAYRPRKHRYRRCIVKRSSHPLSRRWTRLVRVASTRFSSGTQSASAWLVSCSTSHRLSCNAGRAH